MAGGGRLVAQSRDSGCGEYGILSCEKHRRWPASASAFLSVVTVVRLAVKGGWCLCVSFWVDASEALRDIGLSAGGTPGAWWLVDQRMLNEG